MTPEDPSAEIRPNPLFKWLVGGLPLGLLIMGALSFYFYFQRLKSHDSPHASPFAQQLRKDLNEDEWKRYIGIFTTEIGDRSPGKTENIEAATSFTESTMGLDNMGYEIVRRTFGLKEKTRLDLEAELPGKVHPRQLVLVAARYDTADPAGISALMCLAHAFTGTPRSDTIRFVALALGENGSDAATYTKWIGKDQFDQVAVVALGAPADTATIVKGLEGSVKKAQEIPLDAHASLDDLKAAEAQISQLAGQSAF